MAGVTCQQCTAATTPHEGHGIIVHTEGGLVEVWFCTRTCRSRWLIDRAGWRNLSVEDQVADDDD